MATTEHEPIERHEPPAGLLEPTERQGARTAEPQSAPGIEIEPKSESAFARYFELAKYNVTVGSEIMAGVTTFLVMA